MTCCFYPTNKAALSLAASRCQPSLTSPAVAAVTCVRGTWPCHRPRLQPCRAVDVAAALVIGFLPWRGCSQGGFYGTGIQGVHGEDCQAIYQPAAAAERRFAAAQRNPHQAAAAAAAQPAPQLAAGEPKTVTPSVSSTERSTAAAPAAVASSQTTTVAPSALLSSNSNRSEGSRPRGSHGIANESSSNTATKTISNSSSNDVANAVGTLPRQQMRATSGAVAEQMQQVPESVKDLVREILRDDNRARTKQLVDDAWQTLE